ncbi:helix-hairpin-helix domain-containing protein, partial [Acinetobacter baumannii]|uniref:helix-hairpin-helix domain-containing protein n=1 Tax=Acinetobacter baumannii TaxID=470 RepID=UPI001D170EA7
MALGIPDVGEETAKLLARALGSLDRIGRALPDVLVYLPTSEVIELEGFAEISTRNLLHAIDASRKPSLAS